MSAHFNLKGTTDRGIGEVVAKVNRGEGTKTAARMIGFSSVDELRKVKPEEIFAQFDLMDESGNPFPAAKLPERKVLAGERSAETTICFRMRKTGAVRWSLCGGSRRLPAI